jgi:hypothetical protein
MHNRLFSATQYNHYSLDARKALPKNFIELNIYSNPKNIKELVKIQQSKMQEMHLKYNHLLKRNLHGKIVYTLSPQSPEEMIKIGGFKKTYSSLWLSSKSGNNSGCVCFSLLPEITALFRDHTKTNFLYAVVLQEDDDLLLPGTRWRELISPGAFRIPNESFFAARQLLEIKENGQLNLGPLIGRRGKDKNNLIIQGEKFDQFCSNQLVLPKEINQGDDYPLEFEIIDTPQSADFQKEIEIHYQSSNKYINIK